MTNTSDKQNIPIKFLKGEEKNFAIWLGNYRNTLYKDRFINGEIVDGIRLMEILKD